MATAGERYTLSSLAVGNLQEKRVQLNGTELKLGANDDLPTLAGESIRRGDITLAPATVTFLEFAERKHCVSITTRLAMWGTQFVE